MVIYMVIGEPMFTLTLTAQISNIIKILSIIQFSSTAVTSRLLLSVNSLGKLCAYVLSI